MKIHSLVTTCRRPTALAKSLPQISALGAPVLVVNDGDGGELMVPPDLDVQVLHLPQNRGLAGALNTGLSYILADPEVTHISYFQDDVEVDPLFHEVAADVMKHYPHHLFTGNDGREHRVTRPCRVGGFEVQEKKSCRGVQMFAHRSGWERVMPIRSLGLGRPGRPPGAGPEVRGQGSDVDWWIVRDSPKKLPVVCIPGLVRIFLWEGVDSSWGNTSCAGADPPLHRNNIREWLKTRS